jgi:hypothetical protein
LPAASRQVGWVDAYPEQGASHRLGRVEQVIQRPGQVRSGDRGERRVVVQCLQHAAPDQFLKERGRGAVGALDGRWPR